MKFKIFELALIMAVVAAVTAGIMFSKQQDDMSEKLLRLHVVANSDDTDDQALKLKVRDRVLAEIETLDADTAEEATEQLSKKLNNIQSIAADELTKNGCSDAIKVTLEKEWLPTRDYETFALPEGEYETLRVVIGEGEGHNWWCVLFPPLCTASAMEIEKNAAAAGLTKNEITMITEGKYQYKFKIVELIQKIRKYFEGK